MKSPKEKILELVKTKPKHYSKMIKNTPELALWVQENTSVQSSHFAEMIYSAVYGIGNRCINGQIKKFTGFDRGYSGCGPANKCPCVAESVAESVKRAKSIITPEQQQQINRRRCDTNLAKYGVVNVAQTDENRQRFRDWYADPDNVAKNLERIRQTNLEKYGVENCKSLPEVEEKIIATCLARYGVTNVAQIPSTKAKLRARTAEYKLTGHLLKKGYERFQKYVSEKYNFTLITPPEQYQGIRQKNVQEMTFECNVCHTQIEKKFYHSRGLNCEVCNPQNPKFVSNEEQEIYDYITQELGIVDGHQGDKKLINPYELDMVFPDQRIAVEYCGLYWHSEYSSGKDQRYHYNKMELTNQAGYRLITIFGDEWNLKRDIVKSKLANIFGQTHRRYYARQCRVDLVSSRDSAEFCNRHHLQGSSIAKIHLGLYSPDDRLVALMTFSNGRRALNTQSNPTEYELVRFVTDGSSVVGGASRLLKTFIRLYQPTKIISYADLRWSEGNVYETIGFSKETRPTIGYWYVDDYQLREHRYNFTKGQLVKNGADPSKTEWEIMKELGYDRIWDCGHQKYIMNL
jgi:hypothetical protein